MKKIPLSQGEFALVDDEDYEVLSTVKWCAQFKSDTAAAYYAVRIDTSTGQRIKLSMHRVIMQAPKGLVVDHINHDTLDNRRENLRLASIQNNNQNRRRHRNNTSGVPGVHWYKRTGKWEAQIKINGCVKHLGSFTDIEDAKAVRECAEHLVFGEFRYRGSV